MRLHGDANCSPRREQQTVAEVGFYRDRPPLKPVTLGELASLDAGAGGVTDAAPMSS